jgi:hypothetical protein
MSKEEHNFPYGIAPTPSFIHAGVSNVSDQSGPDHRVGGVSELRQHVTVVGVIEVTAHGRRKSIRGRARGDLSGRGPLNSPVTPPLTFSKSPLTTN